MKKIIPRIILSALLLALTLTLVVVASAHFHATRRIEELVIGELQRNGAREASLERVRLGLSGITLEGLEATIHEQKFSIDSLQGSWKIEEVWSYYREAFQTGKFPPGFPLEALTLKRGIAQTGEKNASSFLGELSGVWHKPLEKRSNFIGELTTPLFSLPALEVTVEELGKVVTLVGKGGELRVGEERLPVELLQGVIRDKDGSVTELKGALKTSHFDEVTIQGTLIGKEGEGKLQLETKELSLKELHQIFSQMKFYMSSPPLLPLLIEGGKLKATSRVSWGTKFEEEHAITLSEVSGAYGTVQFQKLTIPLRTVRGKGNTYKILPMEIRGEEATSGITATNLRLKSNGELSPFEGRWKMYFGDIQFLALNAPFRIGAFTLRETPQELLLPITTEKIELQNLLSLLPNNPVKGTGSLSLYLPLEIEKNGKVSLKDGKATGLPPGGEIQYEQSGTGGATSYDFTLRALKSYSYSKLLGTVNLLPDGTLTVQIAMSGKNIELNRTQPIDVNLNVEQNLWKLFESLQAVQEAGNPAKLTLREKSGK